MDKTTAALVSVASVASAPSSARSRPERPREAVWYGALRKPTYTPSGSTIGIAWGVLETLLAVTGYRLLAKPAGSARWCGSGVLGGDPGRTGGVSGDILRRQEARRQRGGGDRHVRLHRGDGGHRLEGR